ncbi:hypothetical protein [Streptomyces sioyaensis]|uniref:hypothetical protein n=1 Tax=Streptomyces sioyaensis TaxID=67364 RepID=UPI0037952ED8
MSPSVTWYHGFEIDGIAYPMRHQLSDRAKNEPVLNERVLGLTKELSRTSCAVHELAHALLWISSGIHVIRVGVGVGPGGQAECGRVAADKRLGWAIAIAAGERAQDRWLREAGLWTEDLAAMAELGARSDRALIFAADPDPRPGFGDGGPDYADLHALADQALDAHWSTIRAALPVLVDSGQMTGDELASTVGLPNGTVSLTA